MKGPKTVTLLPKCVARKVANGTVAKGTVVSKGRPKKKSKKLSVDEQLEQLEHKHAKRK